MFGRRKPPISKLRFCQRGTELPYAALIDYREFTVAIGRISKFRAFPETRPPHNPEIIGLLHGSATFADGSEQPILPVRITFEEPSSYRERSHFGEGGLNQHYGQETKFYFLDLSIADPGHRCFAALDIAFERAVLSGNRFMHVRCHKSEDTLPLETDNGGFTTRYNEIKHILKAIEAEEAQFPQVVFDKLLFHDELRSSAPSWGWSWDEFDAATPAFLSKGVGKYRQRQQKWAGSGAE